ncbi:MAG: histidine phosphatase family protein [Candidatus Heimdallarchaeaceae archaeon]|jgi:broad specificity phosphatase PhoE
MKIIELRRHSKRDKPSSHLTQEGVDLAKKVGETLGDFHKVISSNAPRATETAVAMGYAVDEILDEVSMTPESIGKEVNWGMGFSEYAEVIKKEGETAKYARKMAKFITKIAEKLPDDEYVLIVTHGGLIEICTIGCIPNIDYAFWGKPLENCEGVRLAFDGERFVSAEILRLEN